MAVPLDGQRRDPPVSIEIVVPAHNEARRLPAGLAPGSYVLRVGMYLQRDGKVVPSFQMAGGPPGSGPGYVVLGPVTVEASGP